LKEKPIMQTSNLTRDELTYLDIQAQVGITKHIGGFEATDRLLALCRIESAREVLYVGCGIGVGPTYIAKKFGCHVIGVDISEKMLTWSRQRAHEERVEDRVEFRNGNILSLPFKAGRFDAVIVESVVAFVEDKALAIRECVRVAKPGSCVGMNELFWNQPVSVEVEADILRELGAVPISVEAWQSLWDRAELSNKVFEVYEIDARKELRGRMRWVGVRWTLRAMGRLIAFYISNPNVRKAIKEQWSGTLEKTSAMSYGLFVGEK
jgi:ubiquinone/menaquinone biosynthesis C-methylase UbiE